MTAPGGPDDGPFAAFGRQLAALGQQLGVGPIPDHFAEQARQYIEAERRAKRRRLYHGIAGVLCGLAAVVGYSLAWALNVTVPAWAVIGNGLIFGLLLVALGLADLIGPTS